MGYFVTGVNLVDVKHRRTKNRFGYEESLEVRNVKRRKTKKAATFEQIPTELIYEIWIYSDLSALNLTNRHFHKILDLQNNTYLVRKLIKNNILHHQNYNILNIKVFNYKSVQLPILKEEKVDYICDFNDLDKFQELHDLPQRFYQCHSRDDFPMIHYLLNKNIKIYDLNRFIKYLCENDNLLELTRHDLKQLLHNQEIDIEPLIIALDLQNFKFCKWLVKHFYDAEFLNSSTELGQHLLISKSTKILKFFHKHNIEPNLHS